MMPFLCTSTSKAAKFFLIILISLENLVKNCHSAKMTALLYPSLYLFVFTFRYVKHSAQQMEESFICNPEKRA